MKRLTGPFFLAALGIAGLSCGEQNDELATSVDQLSTADSESPELWFIELTNPSLSEGGSASALRAEKNAFRTAARNQRVRYTERLAFDRLWNGLSVAASRTELGKLSRLPGVKQTWPVVQVLRPEPITADPNDASSLTMIGADVAQSELGFTGAGVRVGVIDTGVDYHHPDLGGCFGAGCRVAYGHDFVGDAFNAQDAAPIVTPDPDPDDCAGHGTHVAGIVGASGGITGVAPDVTIGAYRVFGCLGSTTADIMIAAMERALTDGMQVVNMSIGSAFTWPNYPTGVASTRLVNQGVTVVASIGNSGANGLYSASSPGLGAKVIGVASFDNTQLTLPFFTISPDDRAVAYGSATGAPAAPTSGTAEMARTGTPSSPADGCSPVSGVAGRVALIRRGTCTFHVKALNAQNAGAIGVVLYNNVPGLLSPTVAGPVPITIPVVAITAADGAEINARIAAGGVTMTWTDQVAVVPNPTANQVSSFSSSGLAFDLSLKPDLGAPGGSIRSTYPLELGGYAVLSGTSMAAPHTAGAAALILQAHPNTPSQAVGGMLQATATPRAYPGGPPFLDVVHRQGAGLIAVDRAILHDTSIQPSELALGEIEAGSVTHTLSIVNGSSSEETYTISHSAALATGPNTFAVQYANAPATVSFSATNVTVPAGGSMPFDVTIAPHAALPNRSMFGGWVVVTAANGTTTRAPYAGFKGDYQSIPVLTSAGFGLPWLARDNGAGSLVRQLDGAVYTMEDATQMPLFIVHFDHGARQLTADVVDSAGRSWHRAFTEQYLPRNSTATTFFVFGWDGVTRSGTRTYVVPDGTYTVRFSVLKALGDPANPAHFETWTSPAFVIDRP